MQETEFLKLKKPEYTDPADIEVMNENMDALDGAYRDYGDRLDSLNENKVNWSGQIISGSALAWAEKQTAPTGCASIGGMTDLPYSGSWMLSVELYMWGGWLLLKATHVNTADRWENTRDNDGKWSGWVQRATTTPPTLLDIKYASGVTSNRGYRYKNQSGEVTLNSYFVASAITNDMLIAMLPVGYWPKHVIEIPISLITSGGKFENGNMAIFTDGTIRVLRAGSQTATYGVTSTITYLAQEG